MDSFVNRSFSAWFYGRPCQKWLYLPLNSEVSIVVLPVKRYETLPAAILTEYSTDVHVIPNK